MDDLGLFIIGAILTIIFASFTFIFWRKIKKLNDLRTLRLGRLSFFYLICLWITLNGIIGCGVVFSQSQQGFWVLLMIGELVAIVIGAMIIGLVVPIGIVILTIKMWRRESKSIGNLLLPIVVLFFLLIDWIYVRIGTLPPSWGWLRTLSTVYPLLSVYLAWQFGVFFLSSWVYGRRVRKMDAPYYVVLGAGLIQGEKVGKLLGNRIRAAVNAVRHEKTILVFSGGQGPDEKISEAKAMQKYAVEELNFPIERTILENQSRTTYENLVFSSELIKEKFLFFTSDYHVFRAALFAANIGIEAEGGRGGKTALYYRIPAFIREFIAVLNSEKKKHMFWVGSIVGVFVIIAIFTAIGYNLNH